MDITIPVQLVINVGIILLMVHVLLGIAGYGTFGERKISAYIQDRIGPNRVGFDLGLPFLKPLRGLFGLGQPLADGLKFLLKEDYMPRGADRFLFTLAPMTAVIPALIGWAIIPWGGEVYIKDFTFLGIDFTGGEVLVAGAAINIGVVYVLGVVFLSVYALVLGGWASNNKYSFLGGLRASAQMISYEIPLGISLLIVLLVTGTLLPQGIIEHQVEHGWTIIAQPIAAVIFFTCALAEANRTPFDNTECEQELVGGYHTEYSSMRYALFPLAEYINMATTSAVFALLFLGGYHLPLLSSIGITWFSPSDTSVLGALAKFGVYMGKVVLLILFMMLIRWTIPRLRYDQVMQLAWQTLIPATVVLLVATAICMQLGFGGTLWLLAMNAVLFAAFLAVTPFVPFSTKNKRVRIHGSRFYPVLGGAVATAPSNPVARDDRPVEGTRPV